MWQYLFGPSLHIGKAPIVSALVVVPCVPLELLELEGQLHGAELGLSGVLVGCGVGGAP